MSIALLPMELGDCSEWMRIRKIAYQGPTNLIVHRPVSDESLAEVVEERKKEFNAPGAFHWKVVDVETGKMMTAAKFELHNVGMEKPAKPVDEVATSKDLRFVPPEVNMPALMALLGPLGQARKEVMGERPYLMLDTLSTLPEYQRRGAAALLVKWGAKKADELGIELYLTSSMVARPLYEKMGFVLVKDMWFDRGPWGGEGVDWHGCMIRRPNPKVA